MGYASRGTADRTAQRNLAFSSFLPELDLIGWNFFRYKSSAIERVHVNPGRGESSLFSDRGQRYARKLANDTALRVPLNVEAASLFFRRQQGALRHRMCPYRPWKRTIYCMPFLNAAIFTKRARLYGHDCAGKCVHQSHGYRFEANRVSIVLLTQSSAIDMGSWSATSISRAGDVVAQNILCAAKDRTTCGTRLSAQRNKLMQGSGESDPASLPQSRIARAHPLASQS